MFNITRKKKIQVGVAITIDNRMEVAVFDTDTNSVVQYEQIEIGYNFQTKELSDYLQFASALRNVLDEMRVNIKDTEITITVPNIHFATAQIQSNLDDAEIRTVLATYAQDSYLFKRHEPEIAYQVYQSMGTGETPVVYTAIQESVVDNIRDALLSVGIDSFSINNPYASVINGLVYLGKLDKQINSGEIWNFVQITNNGFTLFSMVGTTIREINDMPLPLKTFAPEEVYESMALSLQNNLSIYPASSLFVISRTDLLSAQQLLQRMELRGNVDYMENNTYMTEPFINIGERVDSAFSKFISVECVGSAITRKDSPLYLCYMTNRDIEDEVYGTWHFAGREIVINDTNLTYIFIGILVAVILFGSGLYVSLDFVNRYIEGQVDSLQAQKDNVEKEIAKVKGESEGNVDTIIASLSKNNKNSVEYFNSISREIPQEIWLSYYYSDAKGALSIKGDTADVESLYGFFNGIKNSVPDTRINLSKLEYNDIDSLLSSSAGGNKSLKFEITGGNYSEETNENTEEEDADKTAGSAKNSKSSAPANKTKDKPQKVSTDKMETLDRDGLPEPPPFEPPATN